MALRRTVFHLFPLLLCLAPGHYLRPTHYNDRTVVCILDVMLLFFVVVIVV